MLGPPRAALLMVVAFGLTVLALDALTTAALARFLTAASESSATPLASSSEETGTAMLCAAMAVAQGLVPLLVLLALRRGTDPVHPAATGALLGITAGAFTVLMAHLRCIDVGAAHGFLAHVAPALALTLLGAGLGSLVLRVRGR